MERNKSIEREKEMIERGKKQLKGQRDSWKAEVIVTFSRRDKTEQEHK